MKTNSQIIERMVEGDGFEPSKAEPADLQSAPFGHSGTPPQIVFVHHQNEWLIHF